MHLSFAGIRLCGAENVKVAQRLRVMIESLCQRLPDHRRPALRTELDQLDRALGKLYPFPEDLALARVPDPRGIGGGAAV